MGITKRAKKPLTPPRWVQGILQRKREYPVIDCIVVLYAAAVLVFQAFLQISPIVTFLTTTPFYSMQTYLGILGAGLILLDLFTTKRLWEGKYGVLLIGIGVLAGLASLRMMDHGLKENLFKVCWCAIYFTLIYSLPHRMSREGLHRFIKILFYSLLTLWFMACCVSLCQYAAQIGYVYVVNPLSADASATRQGFYDSRLFGIFYTLNHSAYVSLLFMIASAFFLLKTKHLSVKILLGIVEFSLLCHILLSGSRSAYISLTVCCAAGAWLALRNRIKTANWKRTVLPIGMAVVVAITCLLGTTGLKSALTYVPNIADEVVYFLSGGNANPNIINPDRNEHDEDLLDREGLEEDASNGRLSIWRDYLSLYKDIGLIGLSPGSYMAYVLENHPELYIVDYVKENYPAKYESNIIYHTHNGYLLVFVATGFLGAACLIAYIFLCVRRVIQILRKKRISHLFAGALLVVVAVAISAVLDEGVFFQNHLHTTLFWFSLGILMLESPEPEPVTEAIESNNTEV